MHGADHISRILDQLCIIISTLLCGSAAPTPRRRPKLSPATVAALILGDSLALMLCGSLTFFIWFIMMSWVLGRVMLFYFVGVLSNISWIGRTLLSSSSSSVTIKDISGELFINNLCGRMGPHSCRDQIAATGALGNPIFEVQSPTTHTPAIKTFAETNVIWMSARPNQHIQVALPPQKCKQTFFTVFMERAKQRSPNWSSLPLDIWSIILHKLPLEDHIRSGTVCSNWLSIVRPLKHCSSEPRVPWLMIPHFHDPSNWTFFDIASNKRSTIHLPELENNKILGSFEGWLVLADHTTANLQLFNPFTRDHFKLPPIIIFPGIVGADRDLHGRVTLYHYQNKYGVVKVAPHDFGEHYIKKAFLGLSDCGYTIIVEAFYNMAFVRMGEASWTAIQTPDHFSRSWPTVTFFKGVLYMMDTNNGLLSLDLNNSCGSPPPFIEVAPPLPNHTRDGRLILLRGRSDILVSSCSYCVSDRRAQVIDISIFKLDKEAGEWVEMSTLSGHSLFLPSLGSPMSPTVMCLPTKDCQTEVRRNCVYVIEGRSLRVWDFDERKSRPNSNKLYQVWDVRPSALENNSSRESIWVNPILTSIM